MVVSRMTDQIGRVLSGRYRLIAPIGTGASAQVYLADDVRLRRRVAVKLLHAALADDDGFLRRFRAEAQAAAALSHPHVLAVYDWGEDQGTPYLVTEYLAGGSLRSMLDKGVRLTPSQALLVGLESARALDVAHRRGFVHRDIKPANLLFGDDGRLRVADFGLARAIAEAAWTEPQGAVLGTARYASPEQAQGQPVDGKADVYALALVLIEAVTGKVPFASDTTIATLMGRVGRTLDVPSDLGPLRRSLERAGRPDPQDRPDAGELAMSFMAAATEMSRPDPLPLAGALAESAIPAPSAVDDRTTLAPPPPPAPPRSLDDTVPITSREPGGEAGAPPAWEPTPYEPGPAPVLYDAEADHDQTEDDFFDYDLDGGGRRRRRWPWVILAVLLAAVIGGAGAYGVMVLRTPSHEVPVLVSLTEERARGLVDEYGWRVDVRKVRVDGTTPGEVTRTEPVAGRELQEGDTLTMYVSLGNTLVEVPKLTDGMAADKALFLITAAELEAAPTEKYHEEVPAGKVIAFDGELPDRLPKEDAIAYTVSKGPQPREVPKGLVGGTPEDAQAALEAVQLEPSIVEAYSDTVDAGLVISVEPKGGAEVPRDSIVEVTVSLGPDLVTVPDIGGLTLNQAINEIESAGLTAGEVFGPASGRPFDTDPSAGNEIERGAEVDIYLRRGR